MAGQRRSRSRSTSILMSIPRSSEITTRETKHGKKRKYGYKGEMVDPEQFKEASDTIVIDEEAEDDDESSLFDDIYREKGSASPPSKRRRGRPPKMRLQTLPRGSDVDDDMESPKSSSWTTKSRQYPMADAFEFPQIVLRKPMSKEMDNSSTVSRSNESDIKQETSYKATDNLLESASPQRPAVVGDSVASPNDKRFESEVSTTNGSTLQEQEESIGIIRDDPSKSVQDDSPQVQQDVPQHPANNNKSHPEIAIVQKHRSDTHSQRSLQVIAPRHTALDTEDGHQEKPIASTDKAGLSDSKEIVEPIAPSPSGMVIAAEGSKSKSRSPPRTSNGQTHQHLNGTSGFPPARTYTHTPPLSQPLPRLAPQGSQPHLQHHPYPQSHHHSHLQQHVQHYPQPQPQPQQHAPPHHPTPAQVPSPTIQTPTSTPTPTPTPSATVSRPSDDHLQTIARQRMLQELKESEKADLIRRVEKVIDDIKKIREQRDMKGPEQKQCQNCTRQPKRYLEPADTAPLQIYPAVPQYPPFVKRYEPDHIIPVEHQAGLRHFLHDLGASFAHWRTTPQESAFRGMMDVLNRFYGP